jgi:hypothetical protein
MNNIDKKYSFKCHDNISALPLAFSFILKSRELIITSHVQPKNSIIASYPWEIYDTKPISHVTKNSIIALWPTTLSEEKEEEETIILEWEREKTLPFLSQNLMGEKMLPSYYKL